MGSVTVDLDLWERDRLKPSQTTMSASLM
jgi:hypothetical protein